MGGFMKNNGSNLGRAVIFSALLLAFPALRLSAQSQSAPDSDAAQISQASRVPARVTQAVDDSNRIALRGNVHRLARAEFDRGAVSDAQPATHLALVLKRSDDQESALQQLLEQQQDKSSPNYHKWLTPQQFGAQFGPADTDIQAVTDWLTSRGFTNIKVSPGRTRVEFDGNIGQISNAFQTQIHHFLVNGKMHTANVSDPQIPAALSPVVRGVTTLHDFRPHALSHRLGTFRKTKDTGVVKPLFTFNGCGSGTSPAPCWAVGPGDFAKIYNAPATVNSALPGAGVTIAIVQDSNINTSDFAQYRSMFGLPPAPAINVIVNGPDPGIQGPDSLTDDEFEADLDTQLAGGVAPGAQIDLVVSQDSQSIGIFGIDLSAIYIIDNNVAPILSESFGDCESDLGSSGEAFYVALWQQASAQGITVVLSAGDSGSAQCDSANTSDVAKGGIAVSGLASTAYNVALGGTDFQNSGTTQNAPGSTSTFWNATNGTNGSFIQTSAKGYIPEWPWNDGCAAAAVVSSLGTCTNAIVSANSNPNSPNFGNDLVAGGGGPSTINTKPAYQSGINGMPSANFRQVPDLSLFAGNGLNASFYIICQQDSNPTAGSSCDLTNNNFTDFQGVGGTSAAAPAFAGVMAMVNQKTGQRQGNANFVLYQLYKNGSGTTICPSAASPAITCIFYDTILGNNSVACAGGSPNCSNATAGSGQFGVIVDPTKANTPAFLTTPGYDNASGLGSVNITTLLNAWSTATFTADTVTLAATSGTSITHGNTVSFSVTLNPTAATGVVALVAKPATGTCTPPSGLGLTTCAQVGIGSFSQSDQTFTLASGVAHITTDQLPGGTAYQVVANYAGDGTFAPGTSNAVTVTVGKEASSTAVNFVTFDSANNPTINAATTIPYGGSYILQIAVSDSQSQQCATAVSACPSGTITLTDNGAPLKDFSGSNQTRLNSLGFAEDQPVNLAVGAHSLVAAYAGDNSFNASTSPAKSISVTAAATTVSIAAAPATNITTATPVTITAKVNTNSIGAGPTGSIVFKANNTQIGNAVAVVPTAGNLNTGANAFSTATITHTFLTSGNVAITAVYTSGDTNYSGNTGTGNITITTTGTVPTTTVATASSSTIASGASVTLNAVVTGSANNGPGVTGAVQFMNGTQTLGAPVNCTSTAGTSTTGGTCKVSLSTALSNVPPGLLNPSNRAPRIPPTAPLTLVTCVLALLLIVTMRRNSAPARRRVAYAIAYALIVVGITATFAGCGGGSSSGGGGGTPTSHVDSITAVYGGDSTYIGSTSQAVAVTVTTN
jgi:Pro-kumamolisin, activation domain/Bacterial Ig-like domain (group 3)